MSGKRWAALGIAAFLFVFSVGVNFASSLFFSDVEKVFGDLFSMSEQSFIEETVEEGDPLTRIAVLDVNGVIQDNGEDMESFLISSGYNHRAFLEQLDYAKEDGAVKAIIIRVNSPGGGVVESAEIHDKIVEIQNEAKKPVYISMGSMAASGGYYISAPAHKIFASPETLTGSLGVIMQGYNFEGLAEKYGVEFVTIKSGPYKDIMSPTREMTKEERKILQRMIDNSYEQFVHVIAEGRNLDVDQVRKIADGRIYDGRQAKELNLIDDFGYFEDVVEAVRKEQKIKDPQIVKFRNNSGLGSLLSYGAKALKSDDLELQGLIEILSHTNSPRLMYLYSE